MLPWIIGGSGRARSRNTITAVICVRASRCLGEMANTGIAMRGTERVICLIFSACITSSLHKKCGGECSKERSGERWWRTLGSRGVDAGPDLWPSCALFRMSPLWRTVFLQGMVTGSGGDRVPGEVRTRGGEGAPPTAYEPLGPSLDPYKHKSHKYRGSLDCRIATFSC